MLTVKTKDIEEPGDKSEFDGVVSPRKSKLGGVKRVFILNSLPQTQECGANIKLSLDHIQPWDLPLTVSADMKVYYTVCGKEDQQSGKCNCVLCTGSSPFLERAELLSIGDLKVLIFVYLLFLTSQK